MSLKAGVESVCVHGRMHVCPCRQKERLQLEYVVISEKHPRDQKRPDVWNRLLKMSWERCFDGFYTLT